MNQSGAGSKRVSLSGFSSDYKLMAEDFMRFIVQCGTFAVDGKTYVVKEFEAEKSV